MVSLQTILFYNDHKHICLSSRRLLCYLSDVYIWFCEYVTRIICLYVDVYMDYVNILYTHNN